MEGSMYSEASCSSNWSTDSVACAFSSFARLLAGRHVYGLCTALTKFRRESHSSSSSLLSPFSVSPSLLMKSRDTFPAGRPRTYVHKHLRIGESLIVRFPRCSKEWHFPDFNYSFRKRYNHHLAFCTANDVSVSTVIILKRWLSKIAFCPFVVHFTCVGTYISQSIEDSFDSRNCCILTYATEIVQHNETSTVMISFRYSDGAIHSPSCSILIAPTSHCVARLLNSATHYSIFNDFSKRWRPWIKVISSVEELSTIRLAFMLRYRFNTNYTGSDYYF